MTSLLIDLYFNAILIKMKEIYCAKMNNYTKIGIKIQNSKKSQK